jgi:hypothetical protein
MLSETTEFPDETRQTFRTPQSQSRPEIPAAAAASRQNCASDASNTFRPAMVTSTVKGQPGGEKFGSVLR